MYSKSLLLCRAWRININILFVIYRFRNQNWSCGLKLFWWKHVVVWGFFSQKHSKHKHKAERQFSHKTSWITSTSVSLWHFVMCVWSVNLHTKHYKNISVCKTYSTLKGQARVLSTPGNSPSAWRTQLRLATALTTVKRHKPKCQAGEPSQPPGLPACSAKKKQASPPGEPGHHNTGVPTQAGPLPAWKCLLLSTALARDNYPSLYFWYSGNKAQQNAPHADQNVLQLLSSAVST